jgi:MFS family permease
VPAVASVLLVLVVREPRASIPPRKAAPAREPGGQLPRRYWRVVALLTLFALVNFPDSLILLKVHQLGYGVAAVIIAYVLYNVVYASLSYPFGALSDRVPRPVVFAIGLACFATCYLGLGLAHGTAAIIPLLVVYGGFTAATDGVGKAWISSLAPAGRQGSAQGMFQGLSGAGGLVAGVWAGLAWGSDGRVPLLFSGAAAAALAVFVAVFGARSREPVSL